MIMGHLNDVRVVISEMLMNSPNKMVSASHPTVCDDASLPVLESTAAPPNASMKKGHDSYSYFFLCALLSLKDVTWTVQDAHFRS